jgi:hypothetical protein
VIVQFTVHPRDEDAGQQGMNVSLCMLNETTLAWVITDNLYKTTYSIEIFTDFFNLDSTQVKFNGLLLSEPFSAFLVNGTRLQVQLIHSHAGKLANIYLLSINQTQLEYVDRLQPYERMKSIQEHSLP